MKCLLRVSYDLVMVRVKASVLSALPDSYRWSALSDCSETEETEQELNIGMDFLLNHWISRPIRWGRVSS